MTRLRAWWRGLRPTERALILMWLAGYIAGVTMGAMATLILKAVTA